MAAALAPRAGRAAGLAGQRRLAAAPRAGPRAVFGLTRPAPASRRCGRSVVAKVAGDHGDAHGSPHEPPHAPPRGVRDDGSTQITLLLSLSVSLMLLPWAARHPTFLMGLPLLAVTPVVGQGVRPLLREALIGLLKALRLSSDWLLHEEHHHGHGHGHAHGHHHHGRHPHATGSPLRVDPRTLPPHAHAAVEPSGPYSEWRPPAERRRPLDGRVAAAAGSPGGSPAASREASFSERQPQPVQQPWPQPQPQPQPLAFQLQQPGHAPAAPSHAAARENLELIEQEEEAMWAAAAASLERATPGAGSSDGGGGSGSGSGGRGGGGGSGAGATAPAVPAAGAGWDEAAASGAGAHPWQTRDPRVLSREEKLQRLLSQQARQPPDVEQP